MNILVLMRSAFLTHSVGLAILTVLGLLGCASGGGSSDGAPRPDLVTASDESDVRKRARLRLELASAYFEQGQTNFALDEVKQAIAVDPSFPETYSLRGLIYMRMNEPRLADESFQRALTLSPRDPDTSHNYAWMLCQQARYPQSMQSFQVALARPTYPGRAKTLMAMGICQARAGQLDEAERSLARSYELDAGNPVTGYNLSALLFRRGEFTRAQFYIRRINNSELANAESLWLGIKVERRVDDRVAMLQLADQLKRRYPQSREFAAYERGNFDE